MKNRKIQISIILSTLAFAFFFFGHSASAATISRPPTNLGLVAYWPLDEATGTAAVDMSGNGNNATVSSGAIWGSGRRGNAIDFNTPASSPNLSVASASSLNFGTGSFTISMWGKYRDFTYPKSWMMIKKSGTCYVAGNPGWDVGHSFSSDGIYICYSDGTNLLQNYNLSFDSGYRPSEIGTKWTHLVLVFDKSANRVKAYVNGVKQTNEYDISAVTGTVSNSSNLTVGTMYGWQSDGLVDDIRMYNRALSASEAASIYKNGQTTRKQVSNSGLVGYWSFNEGSGLVASDSSGNGNIASVNSATWTDGKKGRALSFNGSSSYVSSPTISITNNITASAWVYSTNFSQNGFIVGKNNVNEQWELFFEGPLLRWRGGAPTTDTTYCTAPANSQWHHVVATQSGTDASLYIDGVLCDTGTVTAIANGSGTIDIGRFNGGYYFNGKIDDVRLYNRVLSATEIANLYKQNETKLNSSQNSKLTNGLVGLWSFNGTDISGTTAYDRSSNTNNGTIYGATNTAGKVGQGLSFDGTDDYVFIADNSALSPPSAFSLSAWFKWNGQRFAPATSKDWATILAKGAYGSGEYTILFLRSTDTDNNIIGLYINGTLINSWNSTTVSTDWHQVSASYDGATSKIYLDGVEIDSDPYSTAITDTANDLRIGQSSGGYPFGGLIDEVRVYNRALSAAEMKQLYNMGR